MAAVCSLRGEGRYTIDKGYESNEVIEGAIPDAAVNSGVDTRCWHREYEAVSTAWELSRENTSPVAMAYKACLREAEISPKPDEISNFALLKRAHIDPQKCYAEHEPTVTPSEYG